MTNTQKLRQDKKITGKHLKNNLRFISNVKYILIGEEKNINLEYQHINTKIFLQREVEEWGIINDVSVNQNPTKSMSRGEKMQT